MDSNSVRPLSGDEAFEQSFRRPRSFLNLSFSEQWAIDKSLGLPDWPKSGLQLSEAQRVRVDAYYDPPHQE